MKFITCLFFFFIGFCGFSQNPVSNYRTKKVAVKDSVVIDTVSINPNYFSVKAKNNVLIDSTFYEVDFGKALLKFIKPVETDSIIINYLKYPEFLTKTYQQLDDAIIVENTDNLQKL
ncbi:MAG TPA: hypothetical protein VF985_10640, partial [Mariniflexile sp.]